MFRKSFILFWMLLSVIFISCESDPGTSEVHLPKFFADHMVVQRDQPIRFWGMGIPGKKVIGKMNGKQVETKVDQSGQWLLAFDPLPASGPYEVEINGMLFKDVQVGDVWVAGGQSNMEWVMADQVEGAYNEISDADYNLIRFFKIPHDYDAKTKTDVRGGDWIIANSDNILGFSAVAWFFAKKLHLEKGVAVGIIESNWGGTPAEGWTAAEALTDIAAYREKAQEMLDKADYWNEEIVQNKLRDLKRGELVSSPQNGEIQGVANPGYDDTNWTTVTLPNDKPFEDIAWFRKTITLNKLENMTLQLGEIQQVAHIYLNGGRLWIKDYSQPVQEIPIPSGMLVNGDNILAIRVVNSWNNQAVLGKKGDFYLRSSSHNINLEGNWKFSNTIEEAIPKVERYNWNPGFMYNAMIAPIVKYPIKGVIWYQGESNAGAHMHYKELFSTLIKDWRKQWAIGDFPFLYVQLANFMQRKEVQPDSDWAYLREAQAQVLELPYTGMAVTIDIGDAEDIHPRNKRDVGHRLWAAAQKVAYGDELVLASGPVMEAIVMEGEQAIISFTEVGDGLMTTDGESVKGFVVKDEAGNFFPAEAMITGQAQVTVRSKQVKNIMAVRYGWADNPDVNLYNSAKLPAVPFRSDQ
jgi:sialate O-acetylesterase